MFVSGELSVKFTTAGVASRTGTLPRLAQPQFAPQCIDRFTIEHSLEKKGFLRLAKRYARRTQDFHASGRRTSLASALSLSCPSTLADQRASNGH